MWFSVVCTLIDNDTRHHSGQNLLWTRSGQNFANSLNMQKHHEKNVWERNDAYSLSVRVKTTINHIPICFLPQYQRQRSLFFRARAEKGIASSVVWTLINNGKLANQIARLAANVVFVNHSERTFVFLYPF